MIDIGLQGVVCQDCYDKCPSCESLKNLLKETVNPLSCFLAHHDNPKAQKALGDLLLRIEKVFGKPMLMQEHVRRKGK
jgi:hypothetical protein